MTLHRVLHSRKNPYTLISKQVVMRSDMSALAKALYWYAFSRPSDWTFYTKEILTHFKEGRDAVSRALKELEALGYLKRVQTRDEKGQMSTFIWEWYEEIQIILPQPENPVPANPHLLIKDTKSNYQSKDGGPPTPPDSDLCLPAADDDCLLSSLREQKALCSDEEALRPPISPFISPKNEVKCKSGGRAPAGNADLAHFKASPSPLNQKDDLTLQPEKIGPADPLKISSRIPDIICSFPVSTDFKKKAMEALGIEGTVDLIKHAMRQEKPSAYFAQCVRNLPKEEAGIPQSNLVFHNKLKMFHCKVFSKWRLSVTDVGVNFSHVASLDHTDKDFYVSSESFIEDFNKFFSSIGGHIG